MANGSKTSAEDKAILSLVPVVLQIISFLNREEKENFSKCCRNNLDIVGTYNKQCVRKNFENAIGRFGLKYETLMRHLKTVYGVIVGSVLVGCICDNELLDPTIKIFFPVNKMSMLRRQVKFSGIAAMLEDCKFKQLHRSSSDFCIIFQNDKVQEVRIFGVKIGDSAVENHCDWASGEQCFVGNVYGPALASVSGNTDVSYIGASDNESDDYSDYDNGQVESDNDESDDDSNDHLYQCTDYNDYDNGQEESDNDESDDDSNDHLYQCIDNCVYDHGNGISISVKYRFYCTSVASTISKSYSEGYKSSLKRLVKQNEQHKKIDMLPRMPTLSLIYGLETDENVVF
jgi:hypothetical protein